MSQNGLKWSLKAGERGGDGSQGSCGVLARLIPYGLTNLGCDLIVLHQLVSLAQGYNALYNGNEGHGCNAWHVWLDIGL